MTEIYVDTVKMRNCGNEVLDLVEQFKAVLDAIFERIEKMKEWVGESAQRFIALTIADKTQYYNYANSLYSYGKYLIDCADYFDNLMNDLRRN